MTDFCQHPTARRPHVYHAGRQLVECGVCHLLFWVRRAAQVSEPKEAGPEAAQWLSTA